MPARAGRIKQAGDASPETPTIEPPGPKKPTWKLLRPLFQGNAFLAPQPFTSTTTTTGHFMWFRDFLARTLPPVSSALSSITTPYFRAKQGSCLWPIVPIEYSTILHVTPFSGAGKMTWYCIISVVKNAIPKDHNEKTIKSTTWTVTFYNLMIFNKNL